jgi:deazaflavin-dependent oxidoreductase (nitroreductase family)
MTLTSLLSGMPVMWLTVKGAKTGLLRSLPILCIRDEDNPNIIALVAANWGKDRRPGWYYNLKANPHAQGSIRGQMQKYIAHEAEGEEYIKYWQAANQTYLGFAHYQQRINEGRLPILVLNPVV